MNLKHQVSERKFICQVWLSIWLVVAFYFLCTCLFILSLRATQSAAFLGKWDISTPRFLVWEQQVSPLLSATSMLLKWVWKPLPVFYCTNENKEEVIDWSLWEWSSWKINNMADLLLLRAGQVHMITFCLSIFSSSELKMDMLPGLLPITARQIEVLLLDSLLSFMYAVWDSLKRWSQPFTSPCVLPPCNVMLQFFPSKSSICFPTVHICIRSVFWSLECGRCEDGTVVWV